jgi:hypothetical protein
VFRAPLQSPDDLDRAEAVLVDRLADSVLASVASRVDGDPAGVAGAPGVGLGRSDGPGPGGTEPGPTEHDGSGPGGAGTGATGTYLAPDAFPVGGWWRRIVFLPPGQDSPDTRPPVGAAAGAGDGPAVPMELGEVVAPAALTPAGVVAALAADLLDRSGGWDATASGGGPGAWAPGPVGSPATGPVPAAPGGPSPTSPAGRRPWSEPPAGSTDRSGGPVLGGRRLGPGGSVAPDAPSTVAGVMPHRRPPLGIDPAGRPGSGPAAGSTGAASGGARRFEPAMTGVGAAGAGVAAMSRLAGESPGPPGAHAGERVGYEDGPAQLRPVATAPLLPAPPGGPAALARSGGPPLARPAAWGWPSPGNPTVPGTPEPTWPAPAGPEPPQRWAEPWPGGAGRPAGTWSLPGSVDDLADALAAALADEADLRGLRP